MNKIPIEDRQYVLRSSYQNTHGYYTGSKPTSRLYKAKLFSLKCAKETNQYAFTGPIYEIKQVTQKMLFKSALQGF